MKRTQLIEIVGAAASAAGYDFKCGEAEKIGSTVRNYPAAWLVTPAAYDISGRNEGTISYSLQLHMMGLKGASTVEQLEADALAIAASVCADPAIFCQSGSRGFEISTQSGSLTSHGELSVTLSGVVSMGFYL